MKKSFITLALFLSGLAPVSAQAVSIHLDVEAPSGSLYANTLDVSPCAVTDDPATTTSSAKCALEQAGLDPQWSNYGGDDWFLTALGSTTQDTSKSLYWNWWSDLAYGQVALNKHELTDGDSLLVTLGLLPLRLDAPTTTVAVGATSTIDAEEFGFDASYNGVWTPSTGTTVMIGNITYQTDSEGDVSFVPSSTDPVTATASKVGFVPASLVLTPVDIATTTATSTAATSTTPVEPPAPPAVQVSSGGGGSAVSVQFSVPNAMAYLASQQHPDGSFDASFLSDWAALAYAASGQDSASLRSYLRSTTPTLSSVTDYERHAMALEALGINPYTGTSVDYISPIVSAFDGTQIGDVHLDNDDIFALFPLLAAGYRSSDVVIAKTVAFILSAQSANGSWDNSTDMTAAGVEALSQVRDLPGVSGAIANAEKYLHSAEQANGGFGNSFSTSWALQAISALGEAPSAWAPSGLSPLSYLTSQQSADGGLESSSAVQTRVWATAYAIPAALGKSWSALLQSFPKPASQSDGSLVGQVLGVSIVATSTLPTLATSTLPIATTTLLEVTATTTEATSTSFFISVDAMMESVNRARQIAASAPSLDIATSVPAVVNAPKVGLWSHFWGAVATFMGKIL